MPERRIIRIGTRASRLALAQSSEIRRRLARLHPGVAFRLVKIRTAGDEFKSVEWYQKTGIGVFTSAIEKKLSGKQIDLAVHSLKDLPTTQPKGLVIAAIPKRLSARDALVSPGRHSLRSLPEGARVGTGSSRRAAQMRLIRPDAEVVAIRGNLDTRAAKVLRARKLDAVILAEAGLERLGRYARHRRGIPQGEMLPAAGQGALAIQSRADDSFARALSLPLHDASTALCVEAEREFLKTLRGGCRVPVGVRTRVSNGRLYFTGAVFSTNSARQARGSFCASPQNGKSAARRLARALLKRGARRMLAEARAT